MTDTDLRALAVQAATGNLRAAEELMCAVHDHLFALLHLLGIPASDLEDVAQDIALQLYRSLPSYDPMRPFMPWLKSIALHVRSNLSLLEDPDGNSQCIERLQQRMRNIIALRYHDGLNSDSIGEKLGLKAQTVRKLLSRARTFLRRCLRAFETEAA